jgi:hypothetical protein
MLFPQFGQKGMLFTIALMQFKTSYTFTLQINRNNKKIRGAWRLSPQASSQKPANGQGGI